jgi:RHS repeat-associated protein
LLEVYKDGDADVYERYLWGGQYIDELIRRERDSATDGSFDETHFSSQDGNWNVTALINADGTVAERYLYDAYGTPTVLDADWSADGDGISDYLNPILYAGYFFDGETANFQVRNRYLHTGLGRWMSRDPIGYKDGTNLYEYGVSNPVRLVDPFGSTAHLWPLNGEVRNNTTNAVITTSGDYDDLKIGHCVGGCPGFVIYYHMYPKTSSERLDILASLLIDTDWLESETETTGSLTLSPGQDSWQLREAGVTLIVDVDSIDSVSKPLFTDSSCRTKATFSVPIHSYDVDVYDCPGSTTCVYMSW